MAIPAESSAPPPAPPPSVRPVQVTAAVWCLYALAATQILSVIGTMATMGPTLDATRDYVEGTRDGDTIIASVQIGSYFSLGLGVLFTVGLVVLALFVNRGNQPARIVSWVVLGLLLCCNGFGLLGAAAGGLLGGTGNTGEIDQEELARRIEDAVPGWVAPVNYVVLFIGIVATAAGIILLALPAANEFFRRPQQTWEPPVPGAYYPAPGAAPGPAPAEAPAAGTSVDVTKPPAEPAPSTEPAQSAAPAQPAQSAAPAQPAEPAEPAAAAEPAQPAEPAAAAEPAEPAAAAEPAQPAAAAEPARPAEPVAGATPSTAEPTPPAVPEQRAASDEPAPEAAESGTPAASGEPDKKPGAAGQPGTGNPPPAL